MTDEHHRERLRAEWGHARDGIAALDAGLTVLWANDALGEILDTDLGSWAGRLPFDAVHPDDLARAAGSFEALSAHPGRRGPNTFRLVRADGSAVLVQVWGDNRLDDPGLACLALHIVPLSAERRSDALLAEEYSLLERIALDQPVEATLAELALLVERYGPDASCAISLVEDGRLRVVASLNVDVRLVEAIDGSTVRRSQLNAGEAIDRIDTATAPDLLANERWAHLHDEIAASEHRACWTVAIVSSGGEGSALGVIDLLRTDVGEPEPDDWHVPFLAARLAAVAIERASFVTRLQHQATHDPLTGLRNRRGLAEWLAANDGATATVLFCDLDRFKVMNDRHGHEFGDHLLQVAGQRLLEVAAPGSIVARLGGDEFLLASAAPADDDAALAWAESVRDEFSLPMAVDGIECVARMSIGVARGDAGHHAVDDLIRNADTAVYEAKAAGRNRCIVFDEELRDEHHLRVETERELLAAIEDGHLDVHLQPVIEVATGRIAGLEALARWSHPRRGLLLPTSFIGVAEEAGLITTLDRWVTGRALAMCAAVGDERDEQLAVWVNLSAVDLAHGGLVEELLALNAARPGLGLGVELTETALSADPVGAAEVLGALRDGGLGVAIDDFGTGFSSLAALQTFPFTSVKIDRRFVVGMVDDPRDAAIVKAVVTMAHAFGMVTTAEGVETPEQLEALIAAGIDHVQGFLLARPAPMRELVERYGPALDGPALLR